MFNVTYDLKSRNAKVQWSDLTIGYGARLDLDMTQSSKLSVTAGQYSDELCMSNSVFYGADEMVGGANVSALMATVDERAKIQKLTTDNYTTWKVYMKAHLQKKKLWGAVDKEFVPKFDTTASVDGQKSNLAEHEAALQAAEDSYNEIILNIAENQLVHVEEMSTGFDAWKALALWHEKTSRTSKNRVLRNFFASTYAGGKMEDHLNDLTTQARLIERIGVPLAEDIISSVILNSLPEEYNPLIIAMDAVDDDKLSLAVIKQRVLTASEQLDTHDEALFTNSVKKGSGDNAGGSSNSERRTCF
jgi:hypothetical protein